MKSLTVIVLIATPLLAFAGGLVGHLLGRRATRELDRWRKREETMRLLRWATELAVGADPLGSLAGTEVLGALLDAAILDAEDRDLVAAVARAVASSPHVTLQSGKGRPP